MDGHGGGDYVVVGVEVFVGIDAMVKLCGSNCVMRNEEVCVLMVLLFCAVSGVEGSKCEQRK